MNIKKFNGQHGCPTCLHPGVRQHTQLYLPGTTHHLRTDRSIEQAASRAERSGTAVDSVKGKSVLSGFISLVRGIPIDYMHSVLEGIIQWMLEAWVAPSSHREAYYIGPCVKQIDSQLLQQRPPHDFSRAPRSILKHRKFWKASEFRNWMLYYSLPLLMNVLPPLYLHHYALLVCALHILLQERLTEAKIQAVGEMLVDYYNLLPELYGDRSCTLNAHSLIHLTQYILLWGPLWTQSVREHEWPPNRDASLYVQGCRSPGLFTSCTRYSECSL